MDERDDRKRHEAGDQPDEAPFRGKPSAAALNFDGGAPEERQPAGLRFSTPNAAGSAATASPAADRRVGAAPRRKTLLSAKIVFNDRQTVLNCMVRDMSACGARLVFGVVPSCPKSFDLVLRSGAVRHCEAVYRRENTIGVRFLGLE